MRADPQQQAVYAWETMWPRWNISDIRLLDCRTYIRWACRQYGVKDYPAVKQHDGRAFSWSCGNVISLNANYHKNVAISLHEASHYITDRIFGAVEHHGQEFLGIYMALLTDAQVAPGLALAATAEAHKLKWLPYRSISSKTLKRRKG